MSQGHTPLHKLLRGEARFSGRILVHPPSPPPARPFLKRQHCWRPRCLLQMEGCMVEWFGREMWACCWRCGKRRVFLKEQGSPR